MPVIESLSNQEGSYVDALALSVDQRVLENPDYRRPVEESHDGVLSDRDVHSPEPFFGHDEDALLLPGPATRGPARQRSSSVISLKTLNNAFERWTTELKKYGRELLKPKSHPIRTNEIYYSVFKPPPGTHPLGFDTFGGLQMLGPTKPAEFEAIVGDVRLAIDRGIDPVLISTGSSGSYFVRGTDGQVVGVFKPKDEEPYGPLSPKWTKWIHRNLFPCFFGRSCLIPNNGYVCEAAASILDRQLQTYIVPYTGTVKLSSPSFYYPYFERRRYETKGTPLPAKVGSCQLFLHNYLQANEFLRVYPLPESGELSWPTTQRYTDADVPVFRWTQQVLEQFREELEKLVILDYVMRNTDRGLDNWMIGIEWYTEEDGEKRPALKIGAIDSGLAFPWKHPDEWRSYPFGWLFLPLSLVGQPFSQKTKDHFIPLLSSPEWWQDTTVVLKRAFQRDTEFKERMWKRQLAVLKGQAFNALETLKTHDQGPLELARRTRVMVWDDEMEIPVKVPVETVANAINTPMWEDDHQDRLSPTQPVAGETDTTKLSSFPFLQSQEPGPTKVSRRSIGPGSLPLEAKYRELENERKKADAIVSPGKGSPKPSHRVDDITHGGGSLWRELITDDHGSTSETSQLRTVPRSNDIGFSYAEESASVPVASRTVIIERLQTITSKPPVFTWC
ncbi:phosphatidylinositol 4-kinase Lsb6p [Trichomonascus vanleenenianus]|uniref:1-phosphatidylinositol 4-kinase LSB6 n=1 Tax=Trichomonascus vanleenenianus TaxID=2268995 RepID=UPI003ECA928E